MLTSARARRFLEYDADTGILRWKMRTAADFIDGKYSAKRRAASWNRKYAGRIAATHYNTGHIGVYIDGKSWSAGSVILLMVNGEWPTEFTDHRNGDPTDYRLSNLRPATRSQNSANSKLASNNRSGFKGVTWAPHMSKWKARIRVHQQLRHLGYFDTPEEAHEAYMAAALEAFGEFARAA
jgi:HNH endonuclease/AP2 domain